jgi:hypothetical protein
MATMRVSEWTYRVAYQPDLQAALRALQEKVLSDGDYYWADEGRLARECPDPPADIDELFGSEDVLEEGTRSILDMDEVVIGRNPEYGTIVPVSPAEAMRVAGVEKLTPVHLFALDDLPVEPGFGRCAVLHDPSGNPAEIYFWGKSEG